MGLETQWQHPGSWEEAKTLKEKCCMTCQPSSPHHTEQPNQQESTLGHEILAKYREPTLRNPRSSELIMTWMYRYNLTHDKIRLLTLIGDHPRKSMRRLGGLRAQPSWCQKEKTLQLGWHHPSTQCQKSGDLSQISDNMTDGREKPPQKLKVMMIGKIIIIGEKNTKSRSPSLISRERL